MKFTARANRFSTVWRALRMGLALAAALLPPSLARATTGVISIRANTVYRLTAHHTGTVRFAGDNATLDCAGRFAIRYSSSQGLDCNGAGKCGVIAENRRNVRIRNCDITGAFATGVFFRNVVNGVVGEETLISGPAEGVRLSAATEAQVSEAAVVDSMVDSVIVRGTVGTEIVESYIFRSQHGGVDEGDESVSDKFTRDSLYSDVEVADSADNGLECDNCTRVQYISSTYVHDGNRHGISVDDCREAQIAYTTVTNNRGDASDGLKLENVDNALIINNTARGNGRWDIRQDRFSSGNTFSGNDFGRWTGIPAAH